MINWIFIKAKENKRSTFKLSLLISKKKGFFIDWNCTKVQHPNLNYLKIKLDGNVPCLIIKVFLLLFM